MSKKAKISKKPAKRQLNFFMSIAIALSVAVAGYLIMTTKGAGFFASADPESGTLSGNAKLVADTTAYGSKAIQFTEPVVVTPPPTTPPTPAPTGSSTCPLPKYPTPSCAGLTTAKKATCTTFTTHSGDFSTTANSQTISCMKITGGIIIRNTGIKIRNVEVAGDVTGSGFTIEDSTVGPASGCANNTEGYIGDINFTMSRVYLRNVSEGVRIGGSNSIIQDSYLKLCNPNNSGAHADGIQVYDAGPAKNIVINHNVVDMRGVIYVTAPIFIPTDRAEQGNDGLTATVTNNVVAGGGFGLQMPGDRPMTLTAVTGNKVVDGTWEYDPIDVTCSRVGAWSGNAVVTFDFVAGTIIKTISALNECA